MSTIDTGGMLLGNRECSFGYEPSNVAVTISQTAHGQLREILLRTSEIDDLENGGLLIGRAPFWDEIEILGALESGPRSVRQPLRFQPDFDDDAEWIADTRSLTKGELICCGWWHSHPAGGTLPSDGDLTFWANFLRGPLSLDVPTACGLIATRVVDGWTLHPDVVRAGYGGDGRACCWPARDG
jgi:hypothetical protein